MTQILVARASPSPQFYCAYRSIQAARILPGALKSSTAAPLPPAFTSYLFSRLSLFSSLSLDDAATWPLLLVPRLRSTSAPSNSISGQVSRRFFFSDPSARELGLNFRRSDDLTRFPLLAPGEMSLETKVGHTRHSSSYVVVASKCSSTFVLFMHAKSY